MYWMGCRSSREWAIFEGCPGHSKALALFAAAFAAKGIIQSPIISCSRRDHSLCQASASSILKIFGRRRGGLSTAKGWWDCTAWAKSDIHNCLVSTWFSSTACSERQLLGKWCEFFTTLMPFCHPINKVKTPKESTKNHPPFLVHQMTPEGWLYSPIIHHYTSNNVHVARWRNG